MMYCTWCDEYERDGFNQGDIPGGKTLIDEGTDGLDTDNANGVDDVGELETMPPYPYPLRGITVKLRTTIRSLGLARDPVVPCVYCWSARRCWVVAPTRNNERHGDQRR